MHRHSIIDDLMEKSQKQIKGFFLKITENLPIITYLRQIFSLDNKLDPISYSNNQNITSSKDITQKYRRNALDDTIDKIIIDKKGNKSILFIQPRPGKTLGALSDTFLEFLLLKFIPENEIKFVERTRKSKYYLTQGWKPNSQGNYCEHIKIPQLNENRAEKLRDLIQPIAYYKDSEGKFKVHEIGYFVPVYFLQSDTYDERRPMDGGRRIEVEKLIEWNYITETDGKFGLSEKAHQLIEEVQNLFFIEWWRAYFINFIPDKEKIDFYIDKYHSCSLEIVLRAFVDSIVYKHEPMIKLKLSEIENLVNIEPDLFKSTIDEWIVGEYYGYECIQEDYFIYPPQIIERFWAGTEVMERRYSSSMPYIMRKEEESQLIQFLDSNQRNLIITGEEGIGKTRFLVQVSKKVEPSRKFYWILKDQPVSWQLIEKEMRTTKLVLVIDGLDYYNNAQEIYDKFLQLEIKNEFIKLIIISENENSTKLLLLNHFESRNQESIPIISLNPLDLSNTSVKNNLVRFLLHQGFQIEQVSNLLEFSQGYPDTIEYELGEYHNNSNVGEEGTRVISTFEQRMESDWNQKLNSNEKEILQKLCLVGEISLLNHPFKAKETNNDNLEQSIRHLSETKYIDQTHNIIRIRRIAVRNWILENRWLKQKKNQQGTQ